MLNRMLFGLLVVAAVAAPTASAADGSSLRGYGGPGAVVQGQVASPGTLPFTGVDVAVFVVAGLLVLAVGFGMRRLGRDRA